MAVNAGFLGASQRKTHSRPHRSGVHLRLGLQDGAAINVTKQAIEAALTESADQIDAAIVSAATEAQAQESAAKLAIPFGIVVNIDKSAFEFSLGWSVRHKLTSACPIEDPKQEQLPIE